jgi:hypothetical protein
MVKALVDFEKAILSNVIEKQCLNDYPEFVQYSMMHYDTIVEMAKCYNVEHKIQNFIKHYKGTHFVYKKQNNN